MLYLAVGFVLVARKGVHIMRTTLLRVMFGFSRNKYEQAVGRELRAMIVTVPYIYLAIAGAVCLMPYPMPLVFKIASSVGLLGSIFIAYIQLRASRHFAEEMRSRSMHIDLFEMNILAQIGNMPCPQTFVDKETPGPSTYLMTNTIALDTAYFSMPHWYRFAVCGHELGHVAAGQFRLVCKALNPVWLYADDLLILSVKARYTTLSKILYPLSSYYIKHRDEYIADALSAMLLADARPLAETLALFVPNNAMSECESYIQSHPLAEKRIQKLKKLY